MGRVTYLLPLYSTYFNDLRQLGDGQKLPNGLRISRHERAARNGAKIRTISHTQRSGCMRGLARWFETPVSYRFLLLIFHHYPYAVALGHDSQPDVYSLRWFRGCSETYLG